MDKIVCLALPCLALPCLVLSFLKLNLIYEFGEKFKSSLKMVNCNFTPTQHGMRIFFRIIK